MDFRRFSNCESAHLPIPSTVVTPQVEDYELFHGYKEFYKEIVFNEEKQPFFLVLNLASVLEPELLITEVIQNDTQDRVLQVKVLHSMKSMEGVVPFSRECMYRYILPEHLSDKPLAALWTVDQHLIVVESSNVMESEEGVDIDTSEKKGDVTFIKPRKVNYVYRPAVNADVLRHSVTLFENNLFEVKKCIQQNSFIRPDIGRPSYVEVKDEKDVEYRTSTRSPYLKPEFITDCIDSLAFVLKIAENKLEEGEDSLEEKPVSE